MRSSEDRPVPHFIRRRVPSGFEDFVDADRYIDYQKVVEVALNPDDEMRNLQVALCYSLTSTRMDRRLVYGYRRSRDGELRANANWFTVAQWAVLTVGRNLRTRDLPHRTSALPEALRRRLTPAILNVRAADDRRIAAALSYGQVMVFASVYRALLKWSSFADSHPHAVGPGLFAAEDDLAADHDQEDAPELEGAGPAEAPDSEETNADAGASDSAGADHDATVEVPVQGLDEMVQSFLAEKQAAETKEHEADRAQRRVVKALAVQLGADPIRMDPDDPLQASEAFYEDVLDAITDRSGYQEELIYAFELYRRAAFTSPERREGSEERSRADLIFEATLRIAAVEQVILDEAVTMVVDQLPRHVAEQAEGRLATFAERSLRVPRRIAQVNASKRLTGLSVMARDLWARVMTDQIMVVAFPGETVRIGRDIRLRDWRKPFYAKDLEVLSSGAQALFDQFDRSLGDGRGAGAGDWRRYDDRMNFVSNLLRSRQQDASLFWQPFTEEDVDNVWRGVYPKRIGDPYEQAVRSPSFPIDEDGADLDTVSCDEVAVGRGAYDPEGDLFGETNR
jgi:hypothetical protein